MTLHLSAADAAKLFGKHPKAISKRAKKAAKVPAAKGLEVIGKHGLFLALCREHGLPVPVPEYQFDPERKWAFDWLFVGGEEERRLVAVEIEGGIFGRGKPCPVCKRRPPGAHSSIERLLSDMEKYREAAMAGFVVLRFLPSEIDSGAAFPVIRRALA